TAKPSSGVSSACTSAICFEEQSSTTVHRRWKTVRYGMRRRTPRPGGRPMTVRMRDFDDLSEAERREAARILMAALAHVPSAWHDDVSATAEVNTFVKLPRFGGQYRTRLQGVDWIFGLS